MADITFSKISGLNDPLYKKVEGVVSQHIFDTDKKRTKDKEVLKSIFKMDKSDKFGERVDGVTEFGNFNIVPEGGVAPKDGIQSGFGKLVVHSQFSKSFSSTRQMIKDGDFDGMQQAATNFLMSWDRSRLQFGTDYLTSEGTTFTYNGETLDRTTGDGMGFFSTGHLMKKSATTQSNIFTNELGTDATMLTRLANVGRNFKNDSGNVIGFTYDKIIIPGNCWQMEETIRRIIHSTQVVGSNYNDVNTQQSQWTLVVDHLWQAPSGQNPFIIMSTDFQNAFGGLRFYDRENLDIAHEVDLHTRNIEWNGYARMSVLGADWRCAIMGGASAGTTLS